MFSSLNTVQRLPFQHDESVFRTLEEKVTDEL